jgi:hypothetical protein
MPIRWSALKVSEAIDMAEEFVKEPAEPLEQAKIVATEAQKIANLPGYLDQRLVRLICQIQRIDSVKEAIEAIRKDLPDGAIESEREGLKHGSQPELI